VEQRHELMLDDFDVTWSMVAHHLIETDPDSLIALRNHQEYCEVVSKMEWCSRHFIRYPDRVPSNKTRQIKKGPVLGPFTYEIVRLKSKALYFITAILFTPTTLPSTINEHR